MIDKTKPCFMLGDEPSPDSLCFFLNLGNGKGWLRSEDGAVLFDIKSGNVEKCDCGQDATWLISADESNDLYLYYDEDASYKVQDFIFTCDDCAKAKRDELHDEGKAFGIVVKELIPQAE